jgi:DNA-binding CsgD family transcriptional regulator
MWANANSVASFAGMEPLLAGLDGLAHGVAVLTAAGHVKYANTAARMLMVALNWVEGGSSDVAPAVAPARLWAEPLHRVCHRGLRELLHVPHAEGIGYAALTPVHVHSECFAFVTFGRNELCGPVELQMFAQHCGLTCAEGMVLRQLCRGLTAVQIAQAHGVAPSTVLTQIAAIRNKTLFKSVRELLDSLSRMPPLMAVGMQHSRRAERPHPARALAPHAALN